MNAAYRDNKNPDLYLTGDLLSLRLAFGRLLGRAILSSIEVSALSSRVENWNTPRFPSYSSSEAFLLQTFRKR